MKKILLITSLLFSLTFFVAAQEDTLDCSAAALEATVNELVADTQSNIARITTRARVIRELHLLSLAVEALHDDCAFQQFVENGGAETLEMLQSGGYVLYVRHTHTDRSRGDTSPEQCDTQRILSDRGREEAAMIRPYFDMLDIPVDRIISTEYCRVRETAQLAFGDVDITIPRADMAGQLPDLLSTTPPEGTHTLIVAHIGEIQRVTPYSFDGNDVSENGFEEGDTLIFQPLGDGEYELVGRVDLEDWQSLALLYRQMMDE